MYECKPILTSLDRSRKLNKDMKANTEKRVYEMLKILYKEALGNILHASQATGPGISFAVNFVWRVVFVTLSTESMTKAIFSCFVHNRG